jgi:hypothetical protein
MNGWARAGHSISWRSAAEFFTLKLRHAVFLLKNFMFSAGLGFPA